MGEQRACFSSRLLARRKYACEGCPDEGLSYGLRPPHSAQVVVVPELEISGEAGPPPRGVDKKNPAPDRRRRKPLGSSWSARSVHCPSGTIPWGGQGGRGGCVGGQKVSKKGLPEGLAKKKSTESARLGWCFLLQQCESKARTKRKPRLPPPPQSTKGIVKRP